MDSIVVPVIVVPVRGDEWPVPAKGKNGRCVGGKCEECE